MGRRFQSGDLIGEYRVEAAVSNGYRAFHLVDARGVLIKVWPAATSEAMVRATRMLDALDHPGVAHIVESGALADGRLWTASELPDGLSLHDAVAGRLLRADEVAAVVHDVAEVLTYAHERHVVHGNLRLHSIVLTDTEFSVSVGDWGEAGDLRSSPNVFTPEASDITGDPRTDVYALGVIAYRALTGAFPRRPTNVPGAPPALAHLMLRMLSLDPAARPTAGEAQAAITLMLGGEVPLDVEHEEVDHIPVDIITDKFRRPKWTPATHLATPPELLTPPELEDAVVWPPKRADDFE